MDKYITNPLESIHNVLTCSVRDYSVDRRDAWVYGIVVGWDDESYAELAIKHNWKKEDIERNIFMHQIYIKMRAMLNENL